MSSPIKCAAISNLAQKLASPTLPFSSPALPPDLMEMVAETSESTLSLNKEDEVDLKETLSDIDELLKKELEESAPKEEAPKVEAEIEAKVEIIKEEVVEVEQPVETLELTPTKVEEILETVTVKEEKDEEADESENRISRRPGRPRKITLSEETKPKPAVNVEEESKTTKTKNKDETEKAELSKPGSPQSRPASPSPEVKTRKASFESPPKKVVVAEVKESTPATPEPTEEELEHREWRKSVLLLLGKIMQHKNAHLFISPVNETAAPEYRLGL